MPMSLEDTQGMDNIHYKSWVLIRSREMDIMHAFKFTNLYIEIGQNMEFTTVYS